MLISYLFRVWPFRKVYLESIAFNTEQFGNVPASLFVEEARLHDHVFYDGAYWDTVTMAVYREAWNNSGAETNSRINASTSTSTDPNPSLLEGLQPNDSLDLDAFCTLLRQEIVTSWSKQSIEAEDRLEADLGFDSLSMLQLAEIIDELTDGAQLDWSAELVTVRDAYMWYLTAASVPPSDSL